MASRAASSFSRENDDTAKRRAGATKTASRRRAEDRRAWKGGGRRRRGLIGDRALTHRRRARRVAGASSGFRSSSTPFAGIITTPNFFVTGITPSAIFRSIVRRWTPSNPASSSSDSQGARPWRPRHRRRHWILSSCPLSACMRDQDSATGNGFGPARLSPRFESVPSCVL